MDNRLHGQVDIENGPIEVMRARTLDGGQGLDRGAAKPRELLEREKQLSPVQQ
jgi:hypothetical protein